MSISSSMSLDEDEDIAEFVKCRICFLEYNETDRKPKFMPCSHTLCLQCICNISVSHDLYNLSLSLERNSPYLILFIFTILREGFIIMSQSCVHFVVKLAKSWNCRTMCMHSKCSSKKRKRNWKSCQQICCIKFSHFIKICILTTTMIILQGYY
jgi:hypothetical protein